MKHLGDITQIKGSEVPIVDIVTGGSPCQDLSVAGKRAGLAGERSGLFMEQIRIIKEMREHDRNTRAVVDIRLLRPRFMVWENVPGAFSSNKGEDFRAVLEETARVAEKDAVIPRPENGKWTPSGCIMGDGWSIAWRVHDAQFWGVPQRRKRISLVADFGGATAPEILFERKGVSGDITESGEPGKDAATDVRSGIEETDRVASTITASYGTKWNGNAGAYNGGNFVIQERARKPGGGKGILIQDERIGALSTLNNQSVCCLNDQGGSQMGVTEDATGTLRAEEHGHQPVVYGISSYDSNAMKSSNPHSGIYEADTSRTLDLNGGSPACNQGGMAVVSMATKQLSQNVGDNVAMPICANDYKEPQVVCLEGNGSRPSHQGDGWHEGDPMYTLNSTEHHAVAVENHPADSRVKISEDGMVQTLSSRMGTGGGNVPMVLEKKTYSIDEKMGNTYVHEEQGNTLGARDYKQPQAVVTYQNTTGTLSPGAHAGSYNGQDAYNDMLITQSYQEHTGTVDACIGKGTSNQLANNDMFVANTSVVRRLTPMECERLQGFPDHWTDIGEWIDSKGKKHKDADSPRYKALGNSIALPFWQWMAERMVKVLKNEGDENPTMASLFDGIGGFPLVFSRCGCEPIWASEIEEFPIAVTKLRFPEKENNDPKEGESE